MSYLSYFNKILIAFKVKYNYIISLFVNQKKKKGRKKEKTWRWWYQERQGDLRGMERASRQYLLPITGTLPSASPLLHLQSNLILFSLSLKEKKERRRNHENGLDTVCCCMHCHSQCLLLCQNPSLWFSVPYFFCLSFYLFIYLYILQNIERE